MHGASSDDESSIHPYLLTAQEKKSDESVPGNVKDGLAEDFQFDEDECVFLADKMTNSHNSSIKSRSSRTTFLQQRIDERRKNKSIDRAVQDEAKEEKQQSPSSITENSDNEDQKEENTDATSHSTSDEEPDKVTKQPGVVEEEARLQEALKNEKLRAKSKVEPEQDDEERVKALAFFENNPFVSSGKNKQVSTIKVDTFADFKLSRPILRALNQMELTKPTLIQEYAIPMALLK